MDILVIWLLVLATCAQMVLCVVLVSKVRIFLKLNETLADLVQRSEAAEQEMLEALLGAIKEKAMADSVDEKSAARH